jgi:hypothetical protein
MRIIATGCCAVLELVDISTCTDPYEVLTHAEFHQLVEYDHKPFIIFTEVTQRRGRDHVSREGIYVKDTLYGARLADYILDNKFGTVMKSEERRNRTGNDVRVWIWCPDYNVYRKWFREHYPLPVTGPVIQEANNAPQAVPTHSG